MFCALKLHLSADGEALGAQEGYKKGTLSIYSCELQPWRWAAREKWRRTICMLVRSGRDAWRPASAQEGRLNLTKSCSNQWVWLGICLHSWWSFSHVPTMQILVVRSSPRCMNRSHLLLDIAPVFWCGTVSSSSSSRQASSSFSISCSSSLSDMFLCCLLLFMTQLPSPAALRKNRVRPPCSKPAVYTGYVFLAVYCGD